MTKNERNVLHLIDKHLIKKLITEVDELKWELMSNEIKESEHEKLIWNKIWDEKWDEDFVHLLEKKYKKHCEKMLEMCDNVIAYTKKIVKNYKKELNDEKGTE